MRMARFSYSLLRRGLTCLRHPFERALLLRRFPSGRERIGSDPSKLLEKHRLFFLREALQQTLIESGRRRRKLAGDFLSLFSQMQPNEAVISLVVDAFDQA